MKKNIFVAFALCTVLFAQGLYAQTADEVLDQYFAKIGGKEAWKKVTSMQKTGKSIQSMGGMGMEIPIVIYQKAPNLSKREITAQGNLMVNAFDGKVAWNITPWGGNPKPQQVKDSMQNAELSEQSMLESSLLDYAAKGHKISLEGTKEDVEGTKCFKIKLTKKNGKEEFYYFDKKYSLVMSSATGKNPRTGAAMTSETYYSDYKKVGELLVPHFVETRIQGAQQGGFKVDFKKIDINPAIDDSVFAFPQN